MWKLLPPLNSTLQVLIPTGVLLQPPCSYHIDRCPAPSRGHSSPGWEPCAGASGRPRTPGQPLWSGSAPGWWTSSGPWCKSSPASPCVVGGSWGCSSLRVSKRITLLFSFFHIQAACEVNAKHLSPVTRFALESEEIYISDQSCPRVWPRLPAPTWCASPLCWTGCERVALSLF